MSAVVQGKTRGDGSLTRILFVGFVIRIALFAYPGLPRALTERPEISTPAASWKRLREGLYLFEHGLDPYEGDMFQQSPLLLALFALVPSSNATAVAAVFSVADAVAAYLLWLIAKERERTSNANTVMRVQPWVAAAGFFLHPFTIASCLGRSPSIFSAVMTLSSTLLAYKRSGVAAAFNLAIAAQLSIYPLLLLPPLSMLATASSGSARPRHLAAAIAAFGTSSIFLVLLCRYVGGSWSFLRAVRSLLSVSDLTPNVGLSWYLFIEMFDHFRNFFVGAFHLHIISYVAPLCIKLHDAPLFATAVICGIIATFKSYPSVADVALFHGLLCLFPELLSRASLRLLLVQAQNVLLDMRHPLFSACTLLYATCLLPAFHHLWLYAGSGNANFYYASTLVWSIANGALVIDALYAHLKRDFLIAVSGVEEVPKGFVVIQE